MAVASVNAHTLALYFCARCCDETTRELIKIYPALRARGYEIVFISQDHPSGFQAHFDAMPWLGVSPAAAPAVKVRLRSLMHFPGRAHLDDLAPMVGDALGIAATPSLLLLDGDGIVATDGLNYLLHRREWQKPLRTELDTLHNASWQSELGLPYVPRVAGRETQFETLRSASCDLLEALRARDFDAAHAALDAGANPNAIYRWRDPRPSFAYASGNLPIGIADLHEIVESRCPALCLALGATREGLLETRRRPHRQAAPSASEEAHVCAIVQRLIERGADVNGAGLDVEEDGSGGYFNPLHEHTPLCLATDRGFGEVARLLRAAGATT